VRSGGIWKHKINSKSNADAIAFFTPIYIDATIKSEFLIYLSEIYIMNYVF